MQVSYEQRQSCTLKSFNQILKLKRKIVVIDSLFFPIVRSELLVQEKKWLILSI